MVPPERDHEHAGGLAVRTLSSTQAWIASWASESVPERGSSRVLYWATLINAIGTGMFLVSSAIFFVRFLGLPATRVGLGLSMGSLIGLVSGVPVGHLADRFGARRVYASSLLAEALAMFSYTLAHSWWTFIAATTAASVASVASSAARGPIIQFRRPRPYHPVPVRPQCQRHLKTDPLADPEF
jgi:MFS family permease